MTTPPNNVEIVINEPGLVEIDQTPPPGFSISLSGPQGPKGDVGDQGIQGVQGIQGISAYEVAVADGFVGTEVEWLASLKGNTGDTGAKGDKGDTGAAGFGVPAGGTTNQVLKKNSSTDFDTVWAQAPTPVPTGGSTGQVLKKNSATDYDMTWAADDGLADPTTTKGDLIVRGASAPERLPVALDGFILTTDSASAAGVKWAQNTGWFRGDWAPDSQVYEQTFGGGSIPAPYTGSHVGSASDPYLITTTAVGGTPGTYTTAVKMQIANINSGHQSTLTLPIASLGLTGVTRLKVWTGKTDSNIDSSINRNGTAVFAQHQTTYGWTEREFTAASTDTFTFNCYGAYGVNSGTSGGLFVTGIRIYAMTNPYKVGQFVVYNNTLYRCVVDGNGSTPGTDANWAEVPVGRMPRYTTAARPAAATTNTGLAILDTTLNQVFFSTGTAWVAIPLSAISPTLVDAKGDLLVGSANDTVARLAVGSNNMILTADSAQATGVKWAYAPGPRPTVSAFTATTPFYIAHRGSGDVYPEHTMEAYEASVAAGAKAIEISVSRTADGVLVCHHDLNTLRMTGVDATISDKYYSSLKRNYPVVSEPYLGPAWSTANGKVQIPTLRQVFERFGGKVVMFVEPKDASAACVDETIAMINEFGLNESVMWKEFNALNHVKAHAANLKVWGYLADAADTTTIDTVVSRSDYMGVSVTNTNAFFTTVIGKGKPVIAWPLSRRSEVTRLTALGVVGLMSAGWKYLTSTAPMSTKADGFKEGARMPGEVPWDGAVDQQPGWDLSTQSRTFAGNSGQSLVLGSLCPITATTYSITFDMMFDTLPSDLNQHAGIAFGKSDDQKYQFSTANATAGYHVVFRANGQLQLYTHAAGVTTGTQLATVTTNTPSAGQWMTVKVDVTPTQVVVTRTDASAGATNTFTVTDNQYRGGYLHLSKHNITSSNVVKFRNVVIS